MEKYYFTYGTEGQPFRGGWTEIVAPGIKSACRIFRDLHPDKTDGIMNCASVYTEEQFNRTEMAKDGNYGARCHELIAVVVLPLLIKPVDLGPADITEKALEQVKEVNNLISAAIDERVRHAREELARREMEVEA